MYAAFRRARTTGGIQPEGNIILASRSSHQIAGLPLQQVLKPMFRKLRRSVQITCTFQNRLDHNHVLQKRNLFSENSSEFRQQLPAHNYHSRSAIVQQVGIVPVFEQSVYRDGHSTDLDGAEKTVGERRTIQ